MGLTNHPGRGFGFFISREPAKAEADGSLALRVRQAECTEDVWRFGLDSTGGFRRHSNMEQDS